MRGKPVAGRLNEAADANTPTMSPTPALSLFSNSGPDFPTHPNEPRTSPGFTPRSSAAHPNVHWTNVMTRRPACCAPGSRETTRRIAVSSAMFGAQAEPAGAGSRLLS
jgi:hypothetical protein